MKKQILILIVAFLSATTFAQTAKNDTVKNNLAIQGYDPVAYFESAKAIKGEREITATHNEVIYQFSSENNKDLFLKNPEKYVPQYGGYCAYGVSENHKSPTDPNAFTIVDDKLYLNYNLKVKEIWSKDREARIVKANENWEKLKK